MYCPSHHSFSLSLLSLSLFSLSDGITLTLWRAILVHVGHWATYYATIPSLTASVWLNTCDPGVNSLLKCTGQRVQRVFQEQVQMVRSMILIFQLHRVGSGLRLNCVTVLHLFVKLTLSFSILDTVCCVTNFHWSTNVIASFVATVLDLF